MAAYIIGEIEITDPVLYETYRPLAAAAIALHGGRYLVSGGDGQLLEGDSPLNRTVVLEFEDVAAARAFYDSEDYQAALPIRLGSSKGRLYIVNGVQ